MGRSQDELLLFSFSGGTESGSIVVKAAFDPDFRDEYFNYERVLVTFADTLNEFPYTYDFIKYASNELFPKNWEFTWIKPDMGFHTSSWNKGLIGHYKKYTNIGSKYFPKSCSVALKFSPIYMWLERNLIEHYGYRDRSKKHSFYDFEKEYGKIDVIIGLHYGEEKRMTPENKMDKWFKNTVNVIYPLIEMSYDRTKSQEVFLQHGLPAVMPSNCMICPFASHFDVLHLYKNYNNMYELWVELEANKLEKYSYLGDNNKSVFGEITLPVVLEQAKEKYAEISDENLLKMKQSHGCVASTW